MKYILLVIFVVSLNAEINGQSTILNELYEIDIPFNPKIEIDSFEQVYKSHAKMLTSSEFINPRMKSIPLVKSTCYCKNNIIVKCISNTKNKVEKTSYYSYNNEQKISEVDIINEFKTKMKFEYDTLGRPKILFMQRGEKMLLLESASYKDSVVEISRLNLEGKIISRKEYPYILGQQKHIKSIKYKKNQRKVIYTMIAGENLNKERIFKYKLDENMNWIKRSEYMKMNSRKSARSTTTRRISYK